MAHVSEIIIKDQLKNDRYYELRIHFLVVTKERITCQNIS